MIISHRQENARRVASRDAKAAALGVKPAMDVADARSMFPSLEVVEADTQADRLLLEGIADWCDRYTPMVAVDGEDGLFLDVTGCSHLFGGEDALLKDLLSRLADQGFEARAGLASTPGAAWAAARFCNRLIIEKGGEAAFVGKLPITALRLDELVRGQLEGVGLRLVDALITAPRSSLARRFGRTVLDRLDQALGNREETIGPRLPIPSLSVERKLAEPIVAIEAVERLLAHLAKNLAADLERLGKGGLTFRAALFRVDGVAFRIETALSRPSRDPGVIGKLFHERLNALQEDMDPGYGFDLVRLCAVDVAAFDPVQTDLDSRSLTPSEDILLLTDRVRARLGPGSVSQPAFAESHIPERSTRFLPPARALSGSMDALDQHDRMPERPIRFFSSPDPVEVMTMPEFSFRWRRVVHRAVRMEGPERISPEWWVEESVVPERDYFRIEDEDGRRYWLFREGAGSPRWFIQGLFA